jgi:hypothetical protein
MIAWRKWRFTQPLPPRLHPSRVHSTNCDLRWLRQLLISCIEASQLHLLPSLYGAYMPESQFTKILCGGVAVRNVSLMRHWYADCQPRGETSSTTCIALSELISYKYSSCPSRRQRLQNKHRYVEVTVDSPSYSRIPPARAVDPTR